jgi:hypothetical protein
MNINQAIPSTLDHRISFYALTSAAEAVSLSEPSNYWLTESAPDTRLFSPAFQAQFRMS